MWKIYESKKAQKAIEKLPKHIAERYEFWKSVVIQSSPTGLFQNPGFRDHALSGEWKGSRSSSLNIQFRVIYGITWEEIYVEVHDINAHDYKRRK